MSSETTTGPNVMAGDVITQPGLYESRGGDIVRITGWDKGWWVSEWHGTVTWYGSDGRQRFPAEPDTDHWDLARWVGPLPANEAEPETTSEQLAEIEGQPEAQPEPVQVCEGRWLTRGGDIRNVTPTPESDGYPWWDAAYSETWRANGRYHFGEESPLDLLEYLGPIEPEDKTQEPEGKTQELPAAYTPPEGWRADTIIAELQNRIADLETINAAKEAAVQDKNAKLRERADEFRSEVSYVQNLLGSEKRRVGELEELVTSLQRQLAVAKEELATAAAVCQQLQIELDAAQQVPADSPELRQLQLRLADMTLDRDTYKDAYDRIFADLVTIRETTKAEAVEAIIEWLQPFRGCNSPALALLLLEALPHIIRSLAGLADEEIE